MTLVNPSDWQIRAVQLDLARQRESLDEIRRFIDFAADCGFNLLHLYLEGVVRTETFPWRPAAQSYTLDELAAMVAHADSRGLQTVPCVNTLGHAEHFLSCPEMAPLAGDGDWGGPMFNPHLEETYTFLSAYLAELASVCPAPHFNVGCDEAWQLGRTTGCIAKRNAGATYADLLIGHLQRLQQICRDLGKRPWIWSDLLEYLSDDEVARIPSDYVMCSWHYTAEHIDNDGVAGHFDNLSRRDWLGLFGRLGFDVLVCPAVWSLEATARVTRYARRYQVLGGMQTSWELSGEFLPSMLPSLAATGVLWTAPIDDADAALNLALERHFPQLDATTRLAIGAVTGEGPSAGRALGDVINVPAAGSGRAARQARLHAALLQQAAELTALPELQRQMLACLALGSREAAVASQLHDAVSRRLDPRSDAAATRRQLQACATAYGELAELRAGQWQALRPGIVPERAGAGRAATAARISKLLADEPADAGLVVLRLYLGECYSAPQLRVSLGAAGAWHPVLAGSCKPDDLEYARWTAQVPFRGIAAPDSLRLEVSGFGGLGICFAAVVFGDGRLVPDCISETSGQARDPQAVLADDAFHCYLGEPRTVETLISCNNDERHSLTVQLRPA